MKKSLKTYYFRTYGCQMNELDTEMMIGTLQSRGMEEASEENADLLVFNTCSIRDLAERKVMGKLGQLGRKGKKQIIGVTGCMAMAKKSSLFRKFPHVDFVLGTNNLSDLDAVLDEVLELNRQVLRTEDRFEENLNYLIAERKDPIKAHVSIIRGCDKFCTYCVVPYTRGQEVSRPPESILEECRKLVGQGYKEITLLGQNVNSYGKDRPEWSCLFHDLLYKIDKIPGLLRVRFMTSHPVDITQDLMYAVRDLPTSCHLVHFPIQAGSSRILRKMHRIYTKEEYLEKVSLLRSIVPGVAIGTDIIVGFPTETDEEFRETCDVFRLLGYDVAFLYTYSPRKGTPAMRWKDDVPEEVKAKRLQELMELHATITEKKRESFLGKRVQVLFERKNKDGKHLYGRTRCWKKVIAQGDESLIGQEVVVEVTGFHHQTLIASPLLS
ncbi:MAG: tRNA (N6-isopentenyl adenosine(37)-C2)-methylthiotransferase MiaB [Chlamydiota bacterium]